MESELFYAGRHLVLLCQPPQALSTFFSETRFLIGVGLLGSLGQVHWLAGKLRGLPSLPPSAKNDKNTS